MAACVEIKQTWTQICIFGNFNQSRSYSISANLEVNNGARIVLSYGYLNKNSMTKSKAEDHRNFRRKRPIVEYIIPLK